MSEGAELYNNKHCKVWTEPGARGRPAEPRGPWWVLGNTGHALHHELFLAQRSHSPTDRNWAGFGGLSSSPNV